MRGRAHNRHLERAVELLEAREGIIAAMTTWRAEAEAYGKDDVSRGIGSGLSTVEAGLRLRYEITRKFAPYVDVHYERKFGQTSSIARSNGDSVDDVVGAIGQNAPCHDRRLYHLERKRRKF
jgi:uncharacterized protein involved in copper resistance